jgi:acyl-[acyl-carrier-protein]-phospholipid O-acyltransferase / long-chain-fatty-acid--[acyl-carrier-protein] ligase
MNYKNIKEKAPAVMIHRLEAGPISEHFSRSLASSFMKMAKRRWFLFCMADSTGKDLSYGKALVASLLLSEWIRKNFSQESTVGVLLPASVTAALTNIALVFAGKIPVNLNFTAGPDIIAAAIQQCGIRKILTTEMFRVKAQIEQVEEVVCLEDIKRDVRPLRKVITWLLAFLLPFRLLRFLYSKNQQSQSPATILFSSGSTATPKGVMLSHQNILSDIKGIAEAFHVGCNDRIMGVLPFSHALGFTCNLWFPLVCGLGAIYHSSPADARKIGEMVLRFQTTILVSTPAFYELYTRECSVGEFRSLRYAIVGGEKLGSPLAAAFEEKFGLPLLEGYGCTELSPVVSVNVPRESTGGRGRVGFKRGTAGLPIPGVAAMVVDPESGAPLPPNREGLLIVNGPNRMLGYWGNPEKTKAAFRNGWYVTGDIASIDKEGFITITDRLGRFSKIGGEMVPHMKIEAAINRILGEQGSVVVSVPDKHKGERLVIFYAHADLTPEELWDKLCATDLPKFWIPKRQNCYRIESIPLLGPGKVDLKKVKTLALEYARART